ncbi:MAG TPA: DUF4386 domain-containing protein [Silvibacterium sp.]|jgi:hypothetical protein|nr:DUF4386 domain-containing protein [Silvibacterium sp.]
MASKKSWLMLLTVGSSMQFWGTTACAGVSCEALKNFELPHVKITDAHFIGGVGFDVYGLPPMLPYCRVAALVLVRGTDFLSVFDKPQRDALARLFLNLRSGGFDVAGIFWGLWLFPLGLLVYRSRFIPRFLGVLLMVGTFAYLANSFTSLVAPQYEEVVSRWMDPLQAVELVFMFWLLIMGAKPNPVVSPASPRVAA